MSFDPLARHYRWMEAFLAGGLLQRVRTRWLSEIGSPRRVLLAGEGHGRMLEACATALPSSQFTVIDQSAAMLEVARKKSPTDRVQFLQADIHDWQNPFEPFDLIVTNFFLDCFDEQDLPRVIQNLSSAAAPTANWLVSDFTVPPQGWRRVRARVALTMAYTFFRTATGISARRIIDPRELIQSAGFALQKSETFNCGLLRSDFWTRSTRAF